MDRRYKIALGIVGFTLVVIFARLYFVVVISGDYYRAEAKNNIVRTEVLIPARGQILDRNGKPLAANKLGFSIALSPYLGAKKNRGLLEAKIHKIAALLPQLDAESLQKTYLKKYSPYNHTFITIVDFMPYEEMLKAYTQLLQDEHIKVANTTHRFYPSDTLGAHIIGYIGPANEQDILANPTLKHIGYLGKSGLEKQYNDFLQGQLGYIKTRVNSLNQIINVVDEEKANIRYDITTTIDLELQKQLALEFEGKAGAAVVLDARNGEILAAGSFPEYNLNYFVDGISQGHWDEILNNPNNPLLNKLINGQYPPGSVVKMGVGMAFLEHGGVNENTIIETPPFIEVGARKFRDWKKEGHGSADLLKALRRSVDVYFYKLSQKVGDEKIAATLDTMGFGKRTNIDLPGESSGILPSKQWKLSNRGEVWNVGDTISASIGQGLFLATPLQVARYTALLATGRLPTPHFVRFLGDEEQYYLREDVLSDFQKSKLPTLALGMYQVCNADDGTAKWATVKSKIPLACKTGTAQVVGIAQDVVDRAKEVEMDYFQRSHAWITAFLPYKNPKYVITILVEHGGGGSSASGPLLANIANKMLELGLVEKNYAK